MSAVEPVQDGECRQPVRNDQQASVNEPPSVLFISAVHSLYLALCVYNGTECLTLCFKAHNKAHLWVLQMGVKHFFGSQGLAGKVDSA